MNLPGKYKILVITLSDRAYRGEYEDKSGPRIREMAEEFFIKLNASCSVSNTLIPDDPEMLREKILSSTVDHDIIFTTGGTGIGPRDITPETIKPMLTRELPGVMEFIRMKYGAELPGALISRSIAGLIGRCLIYTLPGSVKAVNEYMNEILRTMEHTLMMLHGIDKH